MMMTRDEARQKQIDAGKTGKSVVGLSINDAMVRLEEQGLTSMVDWADGECVGDPMVAVTLTIGRVRLQVEDGKVIGYAVG